MIRRRNRNRFLLRSRQRSARRARRRGVILLLVLSLLVMFMLVGTAFLLLGRSTISTFKAGETAQRNAPQQADLLDRALRQVLRDTHNRHSAIRYHSLLRDLYGTDGFVAEVLSFDTTNHPLQPQYAGAVANGTTAGPSQGQLIDIFVQDKNWQSVGPPRVDQEAIPNDFVVSLETDANGMSVDYTLSKTDGYYNGCLLTVLSGPAKGQSARILDYDYLDRTAPADPELDGTGLGSAVDNLGDGGDNTGVTKVFRLRVMAFPAANGEILTLDPADPTTNDLAGATFMVNGRPFNGTGVGLNMLSDPTGAKLTAMEFIPNRSNAYAAVEVALAPNARFFNVLNDAANNVFAGFDAGGNPVPLVSGSQQPGGIASLYGDFEGPGGSDESYDAPDYQNMFLASMPLRPRSRGRVGSIRSTGYTTAEIAQYYSNGAVNAPGRIDLDGLPIPSFHRPALVNYWINRMYNAPWLSSLSPVDRIKLILKPHGPDGMISSGDESTGYDVNIAAQIVSLKRKYTLRPLLEDHPNFTGGNSYADFGSAFWSNLNDIDQFISGGVVTFPSWEVAGPWDVDNDGDGVPDSIWVDLGMPVQKTEDGRLYKPLFAILVQDLDNRLNLNAHGSLEDIANKNQVVTRGLAVTSAGNTRPNQPGNLTFGVHRLATGDRGLVSSDQLPHGSGWGPADISLRAVLSSLLPATNNSLVGNAGVDDYARIFQGRPAVTSGPSNPATASGEVWGRYGAGSTQSLTVAVPPRPGIPVDINMGAGSVRLETLDTLSTLERYDYPQFSPAVGRNLQGSPTMRQLGAGQPLAFGMMPDLTSRFAVGLDHSGQPVYESEYEAYNSVPAAPLLADSPYELSLMDHSRRGSISDIELMANSYISGGAVNDDATFTAGELERLLRAADADAGRLPDRLWDLVDQFDPAKLVVQKRQQNGAALPPPPTPAELLQAQIEAATARGAVTTMSFDVPSTNENWTQRLVYGADGQPGVAGVNDNGDTVTYPSNHPMSGQPVVDDPLELNATGSDDYFVVMGENPPENARLIDYLRYRIALELQKQGVPLTENKINLIIHGANLEHSQVRNDRASFGGLLAPEVLAGLKMDLNRPFGDGKDNNGNGIVDEPAEAGEEWIDADGSGGSWGGSSDPIRESDGVAGFYADWNKDGRFTVADWIDAHGTGGRGPVVDHLWQPESNKPVLFDHVNGVDANGRGAVTDNGNPIHDDAQMARQLYARHLYCLALLTMDENYLAPYDPNDAQVVDYLDPESKPEPNFQKPGSPAYLIAQALAGDTNPGVAAAGDPTPTPVQKAEAVRIARRKLTCRRIAQWAINCADARDPDAICTPFEYDENPWDGWNVVDRLDPNDPNDDLFYPIDGDLATDENNRWVLPIDTSGFGAPERQLGHGDSADPSSFINPVTQTRGVVWGMERPELLITETFAYHDRRVEDTQTGVDDSQADVLQGFLTNDDPALENDNDADQRLMPYGAAYIEVYNPWSDDGQLPWEFYKQVNSRVAAKNGGGERTLNSTGVDLAKLSLVGAPDSTDGNRLKRSPVWRMIALEQHPQLRNDDRTDDPVDHLPKEYQKPSGNQGTVRPGTAGPMSPALTRLAQGRTPVQASGIPTRPVVPDPDFPTFNPYAGPARMTQPDSIPSSNPQAPGFNRYRFYVPREYIERAFYFASGTTGGATRDLAAPDVYIPLSSYLVPAPNLPNGAEWTDMLAAAGIERDALPALGGRPGGNPALRVFNHHFVSTVGDFYDTGNPWQLQDGNDVPVAPILPGRYAVIGSPGFAYRDGNSNKYNGRLISPIGRPSNQIDELDRNVTGQDAPTGTGFKEGNRRIEMIPSPNPEAHQFVLDDNAGLESILVDFNDDGTHESNLLEMSVEATIAQDINGSVRLGLVPEAAERLIQPAVAIPVQGMSLSTPLDDYFVRWLELDRGLTATEPRKWHATGAGGEGEFRDFTLQDPLPFDTPFDLPRELVSNHTTPNYRTVHLQRLANPLLPWNPPPQNVDGTPNPRHVATLPVNPYRTVDGASVDLTAFNGNPGRPNQAAGGTLASAEPSSSGHRARLRSSDQVPAYPEEAHAMAHGKTSGVITLASQQRGVAHRGDLHQSGYDDKIGARSIFEQQPPLTLFELQPSINSAPIGTEFNRMLAGNEVAGAKGTLSLDVNLIPGEHVFDFPVHHTLGFANAVHSRRDLQANAPPAPHFYTQSDGENYSRFNADGDDRSGDLIGAPKIDLADTSELNDDTYPWLHWGNRPFASPLELLQVPTSSSSRLTAEFSTYNPSLTTQVNAYNGSKTLADGLALFQQRNNSAPNSGADWQEVLRLTREVRLKSEQAHFGHLANLFTLNPQPARAYVYSNTAVTPRIEAEVMAEGSANLHRLLGYLRVPSRYVGTQARLNPVVFNEAAAAASVRFDPRDNLMAPFNRVDKYREPGRVNLNTVVGQWDTDPRTNATLYASPVYDGMMHRLVDQSLYNTRNTPDPTDDILLQLGHRGPAFRDVVISRRGYVDPMFAGSVGNVRTDASSMSLHPDIPTFFSSPFRESEEGQLVPLTNLVRTGAEATVLRSHPFSPGPNGVWGNDGDDAVSGTPDNVLNDAGEAGLGDDEDLFAVNGLLEPYITGTNNQPVEKTRVPLFSAGTTEPALSSNRNAALRYMPMTRLSSMTTTRSGAFAIWITVGFFEVEAAPEFSSVADKFIGTPIEQRAQYDRVYPDGYQLGKELGHETGDTKRHRGFWIIDRTLPVAFKPGDDVNLEKMILLRREIE